MKIPEESEIPKKEDKERFKNHLKTLYEEHRIRRKDFIISVLIIDNVINKTDITKLEVSDVDLKKEMISRGVELHKIPKEIIKALREHLYLNKEAGIERLFDICERQIYNIFVKRTRVFFNKRIPPSFFRYEVNDV